MKIKELFKDESNWTKLASARSVTGKSISTFDIDARSWCLVGAICKCYPSKEIGIILDKIYSYLQTKRQCPSFIATWNDNPTRTFKDIKNLVETLDI